MSEDALKIEEMRLAHYNASVTFLLAVIGGEVAVVQGLFEASPYKLWAFFSVASLIMACFLSLAACESVIRRISPSPKSGWLRKLSSLFSSSIESEWIKSSLAGIAIGLGLFFFGIFVFCSW